MRIKVAELLRPDVPSVGPPFVPSKMIRVDFFS